MIYKYKHGARIRTHAQVAGEVCASLEERGELTPKSLVDVSRPEDAPLHDEFEWDDSKAAEAYRETQASYIIRSIEVVPEQTEHEVRAFVSVPNEPTMDDGEDDATEGAVPPKPRQQYRSVDVVMRSADGRKTVLAQAFRELASFRRKYVGLTELADVFAAIEKLLAA